MAEKDLNFYKKLSGCYNTTLIEKELGVEKRQLIRNFKNNSSYKFVKINNYDRDVWIFNSTNPLNDRDELYIISKPNENIFVGDIVLWDNENWIITNVVENQVLYTKGILRKTNTIIKFYNHLSTQVEYPAIAKNETMYTLGTDQNSLIPVGNAKLSIIFPLNEDTKNIKRDMVFVVDGVGWEVTNIDKLNHGLIKLLCGETTSVSKIELQNGIVGLKNINSNESISVVGETSSVNTSNLPNVNKPKLL